VPQAGAADAVPLIERLQGRPAAAPLTTAVSPIVPKGTHQHSAYDPFATAVSSSAFVYISAALYRAQCGLGFEILQLELGELASIDVDIDATLTGFSTGEIDVILSSAEDPDDEVIPPVPATPRTKPGDIWILGNHRVGCGDGCDAGFLQQVIGDGSRVDPAFLDPPYNVRIGGHWFNPLGYGFIKPDNGHG
jgi:hypothetical protein